MESYIILGLLLLLLAAVAPGLYALWMRVSGREDKLQFWRALHRRGLSDADVSADRHALAVALRRCTLCPRVDECNEWLASREREGLDAFCPNASYLKRLERS